MVPSLIHGINKTRKRCHCRIFWIVLQRFFYSQKLFCNPKIEESILLYIGRTNRADLPPVSKCSENPDIYSGALIEFPSKPESRKSLYIQTHNIPLQSDVPVYKMSALVPSRVQRNQTERAPVETFRNCLIFGMPTKMKIACSNWINVINLF